MTLIPGGIPFLGGARPYSVGHFLFALVLMLAVLPFVDHLPNGEVIESVLVTLVLLSAVMAVGGQRRTLIVAAVLVTPPVIGKWIHHLRPDLISVNVTNVAAIVFSGFVVFHLLRFILFAPRVDKQVLCAGIAFYLMMGLLWTFAYMLTSRLQPGSIVFTAEPSHTRPMTSNEALFLSYGTMANVNFGDVNLVTKPARMLAIMEAMTGMLYIAMLIARLVSMYSEDDPPPAVQANSNG